VLIVEVKEESGIPSCVSVSNKNLSSPTDVMKEETKNGTTSTSSTCGPTRPACPACGGGLIEIRGKLQCAVCHTICETCCEGGRG
jgi:hypothetical protein